MQGKLILFGLAAVGFLLTVLVPGSEGTIKVRGQYILKTNPDNEELIKYMQEMKMTKECQKEAKETKKVIMVFEGVNKTHRSIKRITKAGSRELIFESGKEFEAQFMGGQMFKNVITINVDTKTIHRVIKMEGFESTQEFAFTPAGFNLTMKANQATATLEYYRWGGLAYDDYFEHGEVPTKR